MTDAPKVRNIAGTLSGRPEDIAALTREEVNALPVEGTHTFPLYGRLFHIVAVFPEAEADRANAYMMANEGASLLAIRDGNLFLANAADKGIQIERAAR